MFARLATRGRCWFIGHIDNYAYLPDAPRLGDELEMTAVYRDSELGPCVNKAVEMLNYAPHPRIEDVFLLPGGGALPVVADTLEYTAALPEVVHRSFHACVEAVDRYPELAHVVPADLRNLVTKFVQLICEDRQLPAAYPGHQVADSDYVQCLLGEPR